MGIISKNVGKAKEVIERLDRDLSLDDTQLLAITASDEEALQRSIISGQIDQLWSVTESGDVEHIFTGQQRELSGSTVVRNPKLVAGTPFDLQVPTRSGGLETLHLLQGVTAVNTDWLIELAPQLFANRRGRLFYDPRIGSLAERQQVRFGKRVLEGASIPRLEDTSENRKLFVKEYARWAYEQLERQRRQLERFHTRVPSIALRHVEQEVAIRANGIVSLDQLSSDGKRTMIALSKLETYLGDSFVHHLGKPRREQHSQDQPRRRGWTPRHKRKRRYD